MEEPEIKHEFDVIDESQCRTCLSVGRKLIPIGKYLEIYRKLIAEFDYQSAFNTELFQVCWECVSLLQKVARFRCRVKKATETLQLGQSYIYGTLSSLSTIILNDTHPYTIYVNEAIKLTDIAIPTSYLTESAKETHVDVLDETEDYVDEIQKDVYEDEPQSIKIEEEIKLPRDNKNNKKNSRWAQKRARQNKKPKFKIVSIKDIDSALRKVQIGPEEAYRCWRERDRDSKRETYRCEKCLLRFRSENSLMKHCEICNVKVPAYTCDICSAGLPRERLAAHVRAHYRRYACRLCARACGDRAAGRAHVRAAHARVLRCVKCALVFSCRREFFKHYKEWHEKFICDHCGVTFKMRYCIKDHIRKQHSPFECAPCGKRFSRYNGLWLHNKTRHPPAASPPAPAYCVECDKRYADTYRYRWHLANSARHKPRKKLRIPCPGCEKVFSKNIYMKDHYNLVHLKHYKYRCEQCNKNFIRNADLVKHTRRVHEGILPPKNKICYMCGRGFTTNKILSNHVRTHTGERPFACAHCSARFAQATALAAHARALHHAAAS